MRIAALYDIHGNLPALEAVLTDVRSSNVDLIVIGGDVIPGPMPVETFALLRNLELPVHFIRGNGENDALTVRSGVTPTRVPERYRGPIQWVAGQLTDDDAAWIRGWNDTTTLVRGALGKVLFCHATPRSDVELFTAQSPDERVQTMLDGVDARIVVCGHTHMQFDRRVQQWRVVNAGSVGMPFGERGAYWAIVGSDVELRRTEYDYEKAAARIRATAFPTAEEFAANNVLSPPSAETMVAAFERR